MSHFRVTHGRSNFAYKSGCKRLKRSGLIEASRSQIEESICVKLQKEIFQGTSSTGTQLMRECQKWKGLLSNQNIKQALSKELEKLVITMVAEVEKIREDFLHRTGKSNVNIPGKEKPPQC